MNAILPQERYEPTIAEMSIGESGYTVPWAMWPDMDGRLWIAGAYTLHDNPHGTAAMKVTRHKDGYEVDIRSGHAAEYRWTPTDQGGSQFVGGTEALPVVEVIS